LRVTPTLSLTNLGVDTNVFNASDVNNPQSDFTVTLTPGADVRLRLGRSHVAASIREDLVYYQQFASERSVNGYYKAAIIAPLNRLSLNAGASYLSARDRPGFEIDARSQRTETGEHGGLEVRAFGKTFVSADLQHATVVFDGAARFLGTNLNQELSRAITSADVTVRHQITPVTSLTFQADREDDRFLYASWRDSASTRVMGGVRFGTRLSGSASVGYRAFEPLAAEVPAFHGLTANADVSLTTVSATRVGVQLIRDLDYSYDTRQPYYLQTGVTVSFTRGLFGPLRGTARGGFQQLAYRGLVGVAAPLPDRTDVVSVFGGSVGYRVAGGVTVSFNVDWQERNSDRAGYSYSGLRYGTSVNYGF
jgi:hypothetical protein